MSDGLDINKKMFESLPNIQSSQDFNKKILDSAPSSSSNATPVKIFKGEIKKMVDFAETVSRGELAASDLTKSQAMTRVSGVIESVDKTIQFLKSPVGQSVFQSSGNKGESRLRLLEQLELSRTVLEASVGSVGSAAKVDDFDFDLDSLVEVTIPEYAPDLSEYSGIQLAQMERIVGHLERTPDLFLDDRIRRGVNLLGSFSEEHPEVITHLDRLLPRGTPIEDVVPVFLAYTRLLALTTTPDSDRSMIARFVNKHSGRDHKWFTSFANGFCALPVEKQAAIAQLIQQESASNSSYHYLNDLVALLTVIPGDSQPLLRELTDDSQFRDDFFRTANNTSVSYEDGTVDVDKTFTYAVLPAMVESPADRLAQRKECFHIAAGHPKALDRVMRDDELYNGLRGIRSGEHRAMLPTLLGLLDADRPMLVKDLVRLIEQGDDLTAANLLDMCKGGYINEAETLLLMKTSPINNDTRMLADQLLLNAGAKRGSAIRAVIAMYEQGTNGALLDRIRTRGINDINLNVLLLASRGHSALADKTLALFDKRTVTQGEMVLRNLVARGELELAVAIDSEPGNLLWSWIDKMPPEKVNNLNIRQLYAISREVARFDPTSQARLNGEISSVLARTERVDAFSKALASIHLGLMENPKKGIQANLNIAYIIEERLARALKVENERNNGFANAANVTASAIMSAYGEINPIHVDALTGLDSFKELMAQFDPEQVAQIHRVLDACKANADFTMRLRQAKIPPPGSPMHAVIVKSLSLPRGAKLTRSHINEVMISGLMTPTRQAGIGSCFATSYVMQQEKSVEGMRQILEDYVQLLNTQKLVRVEGVRVADYTANIDPSFMDKFKGEHYLNRVREFTMASMGVVQEMGLIDTFKGYYKVGGSLNSILKLRLHDVPDSQAILELCTRAAGEWAAANVKIEYAPMGAIPGKPDSLGAWILTNNEREPIRNREQYLGLHESCLQYVADKIKEAFPDISEAIQRAVFGHGGAAELEYNATLSEESESGYPWISSLGGNQPLVAHHYEGGRPIYSKHEFVSNAADALEKCAASFFEGSEHLQELVRESPDMLMPLAFANHALSLDPKQISQMSQAERSRWMENNKRLHQNLMQTRMSDADKSAIIGQLATTVQGSRSTQFLNKDLPALRKAETVGAFWKNLEAAALRDGCALDDVGALEAVVLNRLFANPALWSKFGNTLVLMDNNYYGAPKWGVGVGLGPSALAFHRLNAGGEFRRVENPQTFENRAWAFRQFTSSPSPFDLVQANTLTRSLS